ncbi:FtsX-like permease family protein [Cyanobacteria bacterium FACHB-DQ100]|uniref:ABC transporter permease DevC n=1 Tax=Leptolyngbya sp. DQ-M1 TaxID=2933920 RepID=UPI00198BE07F|nr:FtsX-like permease family protein [Cyanobacteria bacterium FACHB-DQ100]
MHFLLPKRLVNRFAQEPPLAWSQLSHQKVRLVVGLAGISFANILIFMQLGFRAAMFDGVSRIQENLKGDLFLVNRTSQFLGNKTIPKAQLYRANGIQGIASVDPLYYSRTSWVNPQTKELADVNIIAFNPARSAMDLPEIRGQLGTIAQQDTVLFDSKSLPSLGSVGELFSKGDPVNSVVGGRKMSVGGLYSLGSSLFKQGHIVMSDTNYLRLFGQAGADEVHLGMITLEPGANPNAVAQGLQKLLPQDIKVLNRQEFIALEQGYWAKQPPGIIFNFGTVMGFIVGIVIVYQVLYTDVNDHLPEYATLKAIGYSDSRLLGIIFQEAIVLGVLGFLPGFACSVGMYGLLGTLTRVAIVMRPDVALQVFILTLLMCLISAAIAVRKLRSADPADVF